jgi:phosphoribosyl 1,2-cyclic phosphodiesterase
VSGSSTNDDTPPPRIEFLGTGASGGTPGTGRSLRRESSAAVHHRNTTVLIDVTRDFEEQAEALDRLDAILLTHGHRDASGGLAALGRWWERSKGPIPVYAQQAVIDVIRQRFANLEHCEFRVFEPGDRRAICGWIVTCRRVPHAVDEVAYPTVAWKLTRSGHRLVYASDLAAPTDSLRDFSRNAGLLVVDGATCGRRIFTHLRIDEDLEEICSWPAQRILLTQLGRSCPPHEELAEVVAGLCRRAAPCYDGMVTTIPRP